MSWKKYLLTFLILGIGFMGFHLYYKPGFTIITIIGLICTIPVGVCTAFGIKHLAKEFNNQNK